MVALVVLGGVAACSDGQVPSAEPATTTTGPASTTSTPGRPDIDAIAASSAACGTEAAAPAGSTEQTLRSGGIERSYLLTVPEASPDRPPPLVLAFHALSVPNRFVAVGSGLADAARERPLVIVSPSGRLDGATPFWNAAPVDPNEDVVFVSDLLDRLEETVCYDTGRVVAMGMSNGAQISSLTACRIPDRIVGIGAVSGVEYPGFPGDCDGGPVPVVAFHGTADPIVLYEGGGLNAVRIADIQLYKGDVPPGLPDPVGVDMSMEQWADTNGCDPEPTEERVGETSVHRVWSGCDATTELYVLEGKGHQWPGRPMESFDEQFGPGTVEIDATPVILDRLLGPAS